MGYHIILNQDQNGIEHHFVEKIEELANFEITPTTIVYQGEQHWTPDIIKNKEQYQLYSYDWYRAGIKAQQLFKKQALQEKYIVEELSQDKDSFKQYYDISDEFIKLKRGDYILRNVNNYEVDVKCRSFYNVNGRTCFDFNASHLELHLNMIAYTKTPVLIALYKRKKKSDIPDSNSLRMIDIAYMKQLISISKLKPITKTNSWGSSYTVYQIPIKNTMKAFTLIDHLMK